MHIISKRSYIPPYSMMEKVQLNDSWGGGAWYGWRRGRESSLNIKPTAQKLSATGYGFSQVLQRLD